MKETLKKLKLKELLRIAKANKGMLRPEDVVEAARNPKSVLHNSFIWDDTAAAHQYRLEQARLLIRVSVHILAETPGKKTKVFVSLVNDRQRGNGYRSLVDVMKDEDLRKELLSEALRELEYLQRKYSDLKELAGIFRELRKLQKKKL